MIEQSQQSERARQAEQAEQARQREQARQVDERGGEAGSRPDDSKREMIEAIRRCNRSAEPEFLSSFDESTLASYLQRLTHLANRRGRDSVWVRNSSSRAVVTRVHH